MHDAEGLTPAHREALALFSEQCGQAIGAACVVARRGMTSPTPAGNTTDHRAALVTEVGDLLAAIAVMIGADVLSAADMEAAEVRAENKIRSLARDLHHVDMTKVAKDLQIDVDEVP